MEDIGKESAMYIRRWMDYDKFINSTECGYDLCGQYAPFCEGCDKCVPYPCAVSYIKIKSTGEPGSLLDLIRVNSCNSYFPFAKVSVSVYRRIETELKAGIRFRVTTFGTFLNYIYLGHLYDIE